MNKKALVLFSGGQDSTTCLYWAIDKYGKENVKALNIFYGQRHSVEIEAAEKIASMNDIELLQVRMDILENIGDSGLFTDQNISENHVSSDLLPASFVPGRNIFFLTIAAAYAYKFGISDIVTGVCETDYSGYPDCRENTIQSLNETLSLGMGKGFVIHTPLMHLSKKETVELAQSLEGCMEGLKYSHTCYNGQYPPCGECPACILRAKGFEEAGIKDPVYLREE